MTYDLTLHTDTSTWIFVGSVITVALLTMIGVTVASKLASIRDELENLPGTLNDMTRIILRKDFSFKPKFDENDGSLQIGPEQHAPWALYPWHR